MRCLTLSACTALALAVSAQAVSPARVPVMVGGYGDLDACPSLGAIVSLRKGGDGFVAVRAAPSVQAQMLDRLGSGREMLLCADSPDDKWIGVVYPEPFGGAGLEDCGLSEPSDGPPRPYDGVCRSGWVYKPYVQIIAG